MIGKQSRILGGGRGTSPGKLGDIPLSQNEDLFYTNPNLTNTFSTFHPLLVSGHDFHIKTKITVKIQWGIFHSIISPTPLKTIVIRPC